MGKLVGWFYLSLPFLMLFFTLYHTFKRSGEKEKERRKKEESQ